VPSIETQSITQLGCNVNLLVPTKTFHMSKVNTFLEANAREFGIRNKWCKNPKVANTTSVPSEHI
jgi:hypothetical protein